MLKILLGSTIDPDIADICIVAKGNSLFILTSADFFSNPGYRYIKKKVPRGTTKIIQKTLSNLVPTLSLTLVIIVSPTPTLKKRKNIEIKIPIIKDTKVVNKITEM